MNISQCSIIRVYAKFIALVPLGENCIFAHTVTVNVVPEMKESHAGLE